MNSTTIKKFNIDKLDRKAILNLPADINDFDGLSFETTVATGAYDLIFSFIFSLNEFKELVKQAISKNWLNPNGVLYVAYPKKGNKQYDTFIGRDDFFEVIDMDNDGYVYNSPIKFNKMAALNDVFTVIGLKHIEKRKQSKTLSQCVADYTHRVDDVRKHFADSKEVLALFDALTPGYQRGWARHVYSTNSPATTQKRFAAMEDILKKGFKSVDLYRQHKK